eukprot:tig00020723_g13464.t1
MQPAPESDLAPAFPLLSFLESSEFADVTVCCGDRAWRLHRVVLAAGSEYFRSLFTSSSAFVENREACVRLDEAPENEFFEDVLRVLYAAPGGRPPLDLLPDDFGRCVGLATLADRLRVTSLLPHLAALVESHLNVATAPALLRDAVLCGNAPLASLCVRYIAANWEALADEIDFGTVPTDCLVELLSSPALRPRRRAPRTAPAPKPERGGRLAARRRWWLASRRTWRRAGRAWSSPYAAPSRPAPSPPPPRPALPRLLKLISRQECARLCFLEAESLQALFKRAVFDRELVAEAMARRLEILESEAVPAFGPGRHELRPQGVVPVVSFLGRRCGLARYWTNPALSGALRLYTSERGEAPGTAALALALEGARPYEIQARPPRPYSPLPFLGVLSFEFSAGRPDRAMRYWSLHGSPDGRRWRTLRQHKGEASPGAGRAAKWSVEAGGEPLRYLKLACPYGLCLTALEFYGYLSGPAPAPAADAGAGAGAGGPAAEGEAPALGAPVARPGTPGRHRRASSSSSGAGPLVLGPWAPAAA